jgi:hypothetical protein
MELNRIQKFDLHEEVFWSGVLNEADRFARGYIFRPIDILMAISHVAAE